MWLPAIISAIAATSSMRVRIPMFSRMRATPNAFPDSHSRLHGAFYGTNLYPAP